VRNQASWRKLHFRSESFCENDLLGVFKAWGRKQDSCKVAGAPDWLLLCKDPKSGLELSAHNYYKYPFEPDILFDNPEFLVVELKFSKKYEELALAEVLHHAWRLRDERGCPTPVIVTSTFNRAWLRAALSYLRHNDLRPDAIRYLEAAFLQADDGNTQYLWLEEPFASWTRIDELPLDISFPAGWETGEVVWHEVDRAKSWVGTMGEFLEERPCVPEAFVQISRVQGESRYVAHEWTGQHSYSIS
jgi:hypothetical protein